ncbi:DNA-binding protein YbiB [Achromobacter sp. GG226]|uniref:DNA-binding protein YbiB n=1 Tax=Verticiella alkaliphila TaxID=2779529 RepID=UPI001C0C1FC3|nr:DNA-binding protein YbiB [Verticiella sp. GG226]MBU4612329.1 DNA-binding protein YbiB [Verticiella sp. GG226]
MTSEPLFSCAAFIKEIGRGARGARSLSRDDAERLYAAVLAGQVSELELGAVLMAYRIKGESPQELAGMLAAVHAHREPLAVPDGTVPVVIPSYNGARRQPNLLALLAHLLAREGVPVLIHGVLTDPDRTTTAQVLQAMGQPIAGSLDAVGADLQARRLAFAPIEVLAPTLARQLALRRVMGVRNSAHTLAKLIQPFAQPALRLVNYTHPPYRDTLSACFSEPAAAPWPGILLARGTEGEAVADPVVQRPVLWVREGESSECIPAGDPDAREAPALPADRTAEVTAAWIHQVLAGEVPVPVTIALQCATILRIVRERSVSVSPS